MNKATAMALLFCFSTAQADEHVVPTKPNPEVTTGDYCTTDDSDFAGYRYEEKIAYCARNVNRNLKRRVYDSYAIPDRCRSEYTVDHFIPLSMGGSNQTENLWPEHRHIKETRQNLEQEIYLELAEGRISQREAVQVIVNAKMNPPKVFAPPNCH